jgi:hypothetical protein
MMMSSRRRSQEDDKEEDFVNKAPFVFSLKRKYNLSLSLSILPARCEEYRTTFGWGEAILLTIIKKVLLLLLLNPIRALSKGVFLSRAATRRKSLQESRDTKLLILRLGQLSLSKKNSLRLFVRSVCPFRCFLVRLLFVDVVVIFTTTKERKHNLFTSV